MKRFSIIIKIISIIAMIAIAVVVMDNEKVAQFRNLRQKQREMNTNTYEGISGLHSIVTGFEHSGTTVLGTLLYNAPCVMGALETGFLLANKPSNISAVQPWYDWHRDQSDESMNYRLSDEDITAMEEATDFPQMLDILRSRSYLFNDLNEETYCSSPTLMIDKTPKYVRPEYFEDILQKTPGVPVIVTSKSFEALKKSIERRNFTDANEERYNEVADNVNAMMKKYPNRIKIVDFDELMAHPDEVIQDVFQFVNLEWHPEYFNMEGLLKKFENYPEFVRSYEERKFEIGVHSVDEFRESEEQQKNKIVGFWHIGKNYFPSQVSRDDFVMKQAAELLDTYVFSDGLEAEGYDLRLNYVTQVNLSEQTKAHLAQSGLIHEHPPTALDMEDGVEYFEYPTLMELYSFCQKPENHDTTVFYIHSKTDDLKRQAYESYVLGNNCLRCLESEDKRACGVTYKGTNGFPWSHFSGNFWMTTCDYVSELNPPWYPEILDEVRNIPDSRSWMAQPPYGRFFAEYWMMNDAGERRPHQYGGIAPPNLLQDEICSDHYQFFH